jgi:hypothetical protein
VRFLHEGKVQWLFVAVAATLAACWSKELAFPVATAVACTTLFARSVAGQRRIILFALLGGTITFAFLWRHWMLPLPYAVASADVLATLQKGAAAWWLSAAKLLMSATSADGMTHVIVAMLLALAAFSLLTNFVFVKRQRATAVSLGLLFATIVVSFASIVTQWPLAAGFSAMLDGASFGTVTFARFYYAPAAALAIVAGIILSRARLARSLCTLAILCACVLALQTRDLSTQFANWTHTEIRPMSVAATRVAERVAIDTASVPRDAASVPIDAASQNCVVVFLGTQKKQPWFRQFADVTVKALTTDPAKTWRCQVLTESTPWIFISPENAPLVDIGLPTIALDAQGTPKPDYVWGGVRYRYRAITSDLAKLPSARFFEWNGTQFNEVTDAVRSGAKEVKSHGWGF